MVLALTWLAQSVSNKQVSRWHKLMLIYFWFFSFFPLILIPTEVVLKIKEGGAALTSSVAQKELEVSRNQSMYEAVDVPGLDAPGASISGLIPDTHSGNIQFDEKLTQDQPDALAETLHTISSTQSDLSDAVKKENSIIQNKHSSHERKLQEAPSIQERLGSRAGDIEEPPQDEWKSGEETQRQEQEWEANNFISYIMTHKNDHYLYELWLAYYFCTFLNGWFLLPLVVYYFLSGEFSFKKKLLNSAKYNLKYYLVMAIIMVIVLLVLVLRGENLRDVFRVSLSVYNSILYVVFLVSMAHGVARLPVKYFKSKTVKKMYEREVNTFLQKKQKYSEHVLSMNRFYFILQALDEVTIDKFEREKRIIYEIFDQVKLVELDYTERLRLKEDKHLKADKNLDNLVNLHSKIIRLNFQLQLHRAYVFEHLRRLIALNRLSNRLFGTTLNFRDTEFKNLNVESLAKKGLFFRCFPRLEKPFYLYIHPCSRYSLCLFLGLSSLFVLIVETCGGFIANQIVSVVRVIGESPPGVMLIVFFIAYLSFCAYYFFFRFNVFGVVGIKRGKKSNVYSLFYSTSMFVYLTYPICINVFHLFIGEENTCFDQALGKQELASIGKVSLFILAPFIIAIVVLLTFFNVFGRLLRILGIGAENDHDAHLTKSELEAIQKKLNEEVIDAMEDYNDYQHALYRLGRSQNAIDRFI